VRAVRNNQPTTVEVRSVLARVAFPDGEKGRVHLFQLYDPRTHLFWWHYWTLHSTQPDSDVEKQNKAFLDSYYVFIENDRVLGFNSGSVLVSTERYADFETAQAHVASVLESARGGIYAGRYVLPLQAFDTSGIPPFFYSQCGSGDVARMKQVAGQAPVFHVNRMNADGQWRLNISAANGHSVALFIRDNYETVGVQFSPQLDPGVVEKVIREKPIATQRMGQTVHLELRELLIRYRSVGCAGLVKQRFVLIFDPSTHLALWTTLGIDEQFDRTIVETKDRILAVHAIMPGILITESREHYANWDEFQSHVLHLYWQDNLKSRWVVDLRGHLPARFLQEPANGHPKASAPQVLRTNAGWRLVTTGAGGQTAVVELDRGYGVVRATVQRR
jgi:hypothetical protein